MKTRGSMKKGNGSFKVTGDDAAIILRSNGDVDVIVPDFAGDEIVPDPILAMMMLSLLLEGDGIAELAANFKAHARENGMGSLLQ